MVGAGRAGFMHAQNLTEHTPDAVVVAVVDSELDRAESLAGRVGATNYHTTLDEALEEISCDAVVISTPTFTHCDLAVRAAGAEKHVFCEKPMALTVEECDDMTRAANRSGVALQIGFMRRFQDEFVETRRRIAAGDIGEPMVIKSLTRGPGLPPAWAWDLEKSNGMLAEVNSHDFDCVRWLVGSDITRVYAETVNKKGESCGVETANFYDNAVVALRFTSGAVGTIDGTCPANYGYDARVEIVGSEGLLIVGDVHGQPIVEARNRDVGAITPLHRGWPDRFKQGYQDEMRSFVDVALRGHHPAVTGEDGRHAVNAVQAANRSWMEQRPVMLEDPT
jgi:scyllo-inositol 2-dehydrogenase (NAD+)